MIWKKMKKKPNRFLFFQHGFVILAEKLQNQTFISVLLNVHFAVRYTKSEKNRKFGLKNEKPQIYYIAS